jgi:hypothetical protein
MFRPAIALPILAVPQAPRISRRDPPRPIHTQLRAADRVTRRDDSRPAFPQLAVRVAVTRHRLPVRMQRLRHDHATSPNRRSRCNCAPHVRPHVR